MVHFVMLRMIAMKKWSDSQKSEVASGPLQEGPGISDIYPSQAQLEGLLMGTTTDQTEGSVGRAEEAIGQAFPREDPKRKANSSATPATLHPPTLEKYGTAVTGALKHHLKRQNK